MKIPFLEERDLEVMKAEVDTEYFQQLNWAKSLR
jgi:hypothetical protein